MGVEGLVVVVVVVVMTGSKVLCGAY